MSDDPRDHSEERRDASERPNDSSVTPDAPARTGSAAAAAASRARRIGGRAAHGRSDAGTGSTLHADATEAVAHRTGDAATGNDGSVGAATSPGPGKGSPVRLDKRAREDASDTEGAADAIGEADGELDDAQGRAGGQTALRWAPAAVLLAAAIVLAVLVAVSTHGTRWGRPSGGSARDEVLAAAKSCVMATNTYTYDKLDAFEKTGLACATGAFASQFRTSVDKILKKQAPQVKQKQSLQVNTAGIVDVSHNNQWDVLIYGQISVTNTSTTTARIDPFGAVAHLKKVSGRWRISTLCSQSLGGTTDACY